MKRKSQFKPTELGPVAELLQQAKDLSVTTSTELPPMPEIVAMPPEIGRFIPPACCMCAAIVPENRRTTYIDGTKRVVNGPDEMVITRSIRCDNCGNTWTHKELIRHKKS